MAPTIVVQRSPVPKNALACQAFKRVDYADAYNIRISSSVAGLPERYARAMFENPPRWVSLLTALRDRIVSIVGLKTAKALIGKALNYGTGESSARTPPLKVMARTDDAVLFGEDDRHLDFRISIQRTDTVGELCVITAVKLNNWMGHLYFLPVKPLHQIIVPAMMRRAARSLAAAETHPN